MSSLLMLDFSVWLSVQNTLNTLYLTQINSPLGSFPQTISARVLFSAETEPAVQGNSAGQVNNPEVITEGEFICGNCGDYFKTQEELNKHKNEEDDDNQLLEAVQEAEDLYNALEALTQSEFDPEKEKQTKEETKDKLNRFWEIMKKKTDLQKLTRNNVKDLEIEVKRLENELKLSEEVVANQLTDLNNKDVVKETLTKEIENLTKTVKEKSIEISELMEVADEVIEVPQHITMNKHQNENKCNACDKTFRNSQDLDKHMDSKHSEKQCTYCDKMCENPTELVKHHVECIDTGMKSVACKKCDKEFTNFGMRRHKESCQWKQEYDCPECGMIFKTSASMKKHYRNEHKFEQVSSREVCYHWRRGNCTRVNCRYAYFGHQDSNKSTITRTNNTRVPACRNESLCHWLQKGNYSYFHANPKPGRGMEAVFLANLMDGVNEFLISPIFTPCRIFPFSKKGRM